LGAEKYKFDAFESKVKGELGKVQAFGEKARAYVAQIEGKKAEVDVNRLKLMQWSEENKANIDIFTMEIGEKKEIRDIQTKVFDSEVTLQRLQYDSFLAKTQGLSKIYDVGQAALERSYRIVMAALQQNIENVRVQVQRVIAVLEAQTRLSIVTAEANARLGAAAMGMVNLNTSIGNQFHKQVSQSGSASMNTSTQYALHDSYNTSISRQQLYHYQGRVL